MTIREPEFNDDDRAAWFASDLEERRPRNSQGIPIEEATDPAHQYDWEAGLPVTDFSMAKLTAAQDAYAKRYPDADMKSLLWRVSKRASGTGSQSTAP